MQNIQSQLNSKCIEQIRFFCNSSSDVLLFYAPSGTGKNNIVNAAINGLKEDTLTFYYYCNSLSVIEDFLLGFYDTLRDYSIQKRIVLKKDISTDFTEKVSNYMKSIKQNTVIIIDNYEKIEENENINKFLGNIAKQEKTKLILLSRKNVSLMRFQLDGLKTNRLEKQFVEEDAAIQQICFACPAEELETIRNLYKIAEANIILIQTAVCFMRMTNIRLNALLDEYNKKGGKFEDFITVKILSLIPQNYMDTIKTLSLTNFLPTTSYLVKYNLSDITSIPYLKQRFIVNQINQNIYEYEHIKNHLIQKLDASDKLQYGDLIINSLNQELAKGPKDRVLRLSREGLRKQIESLENNVPRVNPKSPTNNEVSYYSQAKNISAPWLDKNGTLQMPTQDEPKKTPAQTKAELIKQFRQSTFDSLIQKQEETKPTNKIDLIEKIREYENNYDFQNVIESLQELLKIDHEDENNILEKIADNYCKLNKLDEAANYYTKISENYKNQNDKTNYYNTIMKVANIRVKSYDLNSAGKMYYKIINEDRNLENIVDAYCSLGDIEEKKNNEEGMLENYKDALNFALDNNLNEKASNIYYLLGSVFEKKNNQKEAKYNYQNSIQYGNKNSSLADSHLALASILFDEGNIKDAIYNYEMAISKYQQETKPNANSLYSANTNLAYIYKSVNSNKEETCLTEALKWARELKDRFEIATTYVALGDFYYNASLNKRALFNYLRARDMLNEGKNSKNQRMIASRIEDIKYKMGNNFDNLVREYEERRNQFIKKRT